jgi:hypothetical protein
MKYKALLLGFLLLLPMGLLATTTHNAAATIMPTLAVVPKDIEFQEPCIKGTTFTVSVILWNTGLTGYDIYAFDFVLNFAAIKDWARLVNNTIVVTSPWPAGSYFLVANETSPKILPAGQSYFTDIHLAMTAMPPGGGLVEVNQTILSFQMKIRQDICWPTYINITDAICFTSVQMSSDGTLVKPIPPGEFEADCARFEFASVQPSMELVDADAFLNATDLTSGKVWGTEMIVEKCMSHETDVAVHLNNVTGVFGFGFTLNFDPTVLEVDVQKVTVKAAFPPPYEYMNFVYTPTDYVLEVPGSNCISVSVIRPSEKPGVCGADIVAIDIVFHTIDMQVPVDSVPYPYGPNHDPVTAWGPYLDQDPVNFAGGMIPTGRKAWINLTSGWILSKCGPYAFIADSLGPPYSTMIQYSFNNPTLPAGYVPDQVWDGPGLPWYPTSGIVGGLIYGIWTNTNPFGISNTLINSATNLPKEKYDAILYWFHPYKYDLNLDCVVDIQDLMVLAPYYALPPMPVGSYADLYKPALPAADDHIVDIYDFVAIAKHFGPVDP